MIKFVSLIGLISISIFIISCGNDEASDTSCLLLSDQLAYSYTDEEGNLIQIYDNGEAYLIDNGDCTFIAQYFIPGFFEETYVRTDSGTCIILDANNVFKPFRNHEIDFEGITDKLDLIIENESQTDRIFTNFTLQSPSAKTVNEYVALQNCILDGSCDFIDNRFDFAESPTESGNQVLRFFSVAPTADMVTAKSSIVSSLVFFEKGDDFWFEAMYYVDGPLPTTIADFESSFFEGSPGPRLIFREDNLVVENKFGDKLNFVQTAGQEITFPTEQWIKIKVHLRYDENNGIIQVWQDDVLIIDTSGQNIPLNIWVQNRLEIGITATDNETTLYMDNIRISDEPI